MSINIQDLIAYTTSQTSTTFENKGKVAMITGITGQDGSYLVQFLLNKGYNIVGITRMSSYINPEIQRHFSKFKDFDKRVKFYYSDMTDTSSLLRIIKTVQPDEVYHLAAQSHVKVSYELPEYTCNVDALGTLRLLESIRCADLIHKVRFYQAFTSDVFEKAGQGKAQDENSKILPKSPYSCAKLFCYWIVRNYREAYNLFAVNGILFSHESSRRGPTFVTRKITIAVAKIKYELQECLYLGNLDARRDWGHAKDFVEAMWLMLQQDKPDDYCIATGEAHSVREFCEIAFKHAGIDIEWKGEKGTVEEVGVDKSKGKIVVRIDPKFFRPTDNESMLGDPSKAEKQLGWKRKISFDQLVRKMVNHDLKKVQRDVQLKKLEQSGTSSCDGVGNDSKTTTTTTSSSSSN